MLWRLTLCWVREQTGLKSKDDHEKLRASSFLATDSKLHALLPRMLHTFDYISTISLFPSNLLFGEHPWALCSLPTVLNSALLQSLCQHILHTMLLKGIYESAFYWSLHRLSDRCGCTSVAQLVVHKRLPWIHQHMHEHHCSQSFNINVRFSRARQILKLRTGRDKKLVINHDQVNPLCLFSLLFLNEASIQIHKYIEPKAREKVCTQLDSLIWIHWGVVHRQDYKNDSFKHFWAWLYNAETAL